MPSPCVCEREWVRVSLKMHFWTHPTHTDWTTAHLYSICAQNSLIVLLTSMDSVL